MGEAKENLAEEGVEEVRRSVSRYMECGKLPDFLACYVRTWGDGCPSQGILRPASRT